MGFVPLPGLPRVYDSQAASRGCPERIQQTQVSVAPSSDSHFLEHISVVNGNSASGAMRLRESIYRARRKYLAIR